MACAKKPSTSADPIKPVILGFQAAPLARLRQHYCELFKKPPPPAFSADLLRRVMAYRIHEDRLGGLNTKTKAALLERCDASIAGKSRGSRQLAIGCVLVRDYGGHSHRVTVAKDGFEYNGKIFANLSEIALHITGTKWNGPRFFGLRKASHQGKRNEGKR